MAESCFELRGANDGFATDDVFMCARKVCYVVVEEVNLGEGEARAIETIAHGTVQ